ncbi:glutathione S-transferase [Inhella inkyongensis]|uniref:Glutathione S-transferase n=1 Tax=Inhella inkyongensis TaxID=392593 RepID=A0A840S8M9_9BURK|nr:glutathione transferase GstA [Inhella inkyongensis]MBB5205972.1 glutathione S-transferase [Inhella inkyongensis]
MKLYYSPAACSLASHIVLRETGQDFELIKVDTQTHRTASGADYFGINPKGQVPLLELEDGQRLSEGPVIAQYIADRKGARDLMPEPGSLARYRVQEWQNYISTELHKSFTPLFNPELDAKAKTTLRAVLNKKLAWLDGQMQGRRFLTGEAFTAADAYLFVVLGWAQYVDVDLQPFAGLLNFRTRVAQRPAVRAALQAEGLLQ